MSKNWTPLFCPNCQSKRYLFTLDMPPRVKCADCPTVYDLPLPKLTEKRKAAPGIRHHRDKDPRELEVNPVSPPPLQAHGTLTRYTTEILAGGPRALIAAQHKAAKLSELFGEAFESQWCLTTAYLRQLSCGVDPAAKEQPDDAIGRYSMTKRIAPARGMRCRGVPGSWRFWRYRRRH